MKDLWTYLKETDKPIVLYGTGNGADKIYARLKKHGIKINGVFSSDGFKKGKEFYGFTVTSYSEHKANFSDMIILVCFGSHLENVISDILKLKEENELYMPDVPVYGEEIFDIEFALKHKDKLEKVYNMLCDEQSKHVFENTVYYKITGNIDYLTSCETTYDETMSIIKPLGETYLDLGAFDGDTVNQFIKYDNNYKAIIALEPDNRNFKKLTVNTEGLDNITLLNCAVDEKKDTVLMAKNKGRGNSKQEKTIEISALNIDYISEINFPTFIKIDIEGNELSAIKGGINTIKNKPKMQVACYHRSEDLFLLPNEILKINPDYKIYMRRQRALPAWDINFIFI
ncbi:MAG: FkbM family methyltransferase [Ruminococcaceae bacterium]|nr:FkbM family methyltransferase [Oscillospiraceae bacterium]